MYKIVLVEMDAQRPRSETADGDGAKKLKHIFKSNE